MPSSSITLPAKPDHVPAALVHDVDIFEGPAPGDDSQTRWVKIRDAAPGDVFWTPRNGGHWIATRAREVSLMQRDDGTTFSHEIISLPREATFPLYPLTLDGARQMQFRKLILPSFMPRAVAALEEKARAHAIAAIDAFAARGECEFVSEFASILPIAVFLGIVDLPWADREKLVEWTEVMTRSSDIMARYQALSNMTQYLNGWLEARTAKPGDDWLSTIVAGEVDGRPLSDQERMSVALLMLFGGLDTVASMLGFIARFLAMNPAHRQQLIDDPALIPNAIEELVRRHGIAQTRRLVKKDIDLAGAPIKADELVLVVNALAGLDDRVVDDPMTVDFRREKPAHATFGNGRHACPGALLARREIKVFIEEWLARIPEFGIKPGTMPEIGCGMVNGVTKLELAW
ncbi:MAG: cytochrome P450 [Sphingorhabdus sp.]